MEKRYTVVNNLQSDHAQYQGMMAGQITDESLLLHINSAAPPWLLNAEWGYAGGYQSRVARYVIGGPTTKPLPT